MIELVLKMYPRAWRERYEDEFRALLEDTGCSPRIVANVAWGALRMQLRHRHAVLTTALFLAGFALLEAVALRTGVTENIFWRPDGPASLALLVGVVGCLLMVLRPAWAPVVRRIRP